VRPRSIAGLGDLGLEVEVDGTKGIWRIDPDLLDRPFAGRTAVLSPFDRLIHYRKRALELFGFDYKLEIYIPVAKRRWGYYVLPILRGDRMIAKADARTDPATPRRDETHDVDEAGKIEYMGGANAQASELRATAGHLQETATDFDRRATLLEAAAHLTKGEPKLFGERDDVRQRVTDAEGRSATADAHLHETGLNEHDRTIYTA